MIKAGLNAFTLYQIIPGFNNPSKEAFVLWEKEDMLVSIYSPFLTMFSTLSKKHSSFATFLI